VRWRALLVMLAWPAAGSFAADPPPVPERRPSTIFSANRCFVVRGLPPQGAISVARWAEDVAERLEELTKCDIPLSQFQVVEIVGREAGTGGVARVIRAQGCPDDRLQQRLVLENPPGVDQEDALEGLCWLLMNRMAIRRQTLEQRRTSLAEVPDWLSTGVAQNLYAELRLRNARLFEKRWTGGDARSAYSIVRREYLPQGRWAEKADAAFLAGWILSLPQGHQILVDAFERIAGGGTVDLSFLVSASGAATERDASIAWDLWVAHELSRTKELGVISRERLEELKAALIVRTEEYGFGSPVGVPPVLAPADFVAHRSEPWARELAVRIGQRLGALTAGQSKEFTAVADAYRTYFLHVAGTGGGAGSTRAPPKALLRELEKADQLLVDLESGVARRKEYLDRIAGEGDLVPLTGEPPAESSGAPVRSYLDRIEDELGGQAPGQSGLR
jgi:hypothetical protein